jgi:MFS family permease
MAMACAMASLIGFGMGAEADVMPYLISRRFGLRSMAELYGVAFSAYALAGAAGPALMGLVSRTGSYRLLTPILAALIAVSGLLLLTLRAGRPSPSELEHQFQG